MMIVEVEVVVVGTVMMYMVQWCIEKWRRRRRMLVLMMIHVLFSTHRTLHHR